MVETASGSAPELPAGQPPQATRRRPPPSRIAPEALAAERGGAIEGLDWLGRKPEAKASLLYRLARLLARFVLFIVLRFRIRAEGADRLPKAPYIVVAAAHRGWMDPFVVMHALPASPRAWFLGSGPSTLTSRSREALIRRLGGLLPVWRGGVGIDVHVASARAVLANGAIFAQMPEGTVSGPAGRLGPFRTGAALIALRTNATIVPIAIAGTEELYIGKRIASRVLGAGDARTFLPDWDGVVPEPGSRAELTLAKDLSRALEAVLAPAVEELYPWTLDPARRRRLLRRQLTWLLLRPGRLDRETAAP